MIDFPKKLYNIIYMDPPWSFGVWKDQKTRTADSHYSVMSYSSINDLPITEISADNCALFIWCPNSFLEACMKSINCYGFSYKTVAFTWVKMRKDMLKPHIGMGHYTRQETEHCLLGMKGHLDRIGKGVEEVILAPRSEHSAKPDATRKRIVDLFGDLPRIELFARDVSTMQYSDGWEFWGNELERRQNER